MYNNLKYGNQSNPNHNVRDLNTSLYRMRALGAISLLIPGPKMIWHFGDLGMDLSINTCTDGSVDPNCRLATKPQPQWVNDWLHTPERNQIYFDWSRMLSLKANEAVFNGSVSINSGGFTPIIYIWDDNIPSTEIKNVVILSNFDVNNHSVTPNFPYTGTWYNLMDNSSINVTSTTDPIDLGPGEYRIYANQPTTLASAEIKNLDFEIYPNPAKNLLYVNKILTKMEIYNLSGQLIKAVEGHVTDNNFYNLTDIPNGFYFVKAYQNKRVGIKKLIINR
jgi:hypothetical protein